MSHWLFHGNCVDVMRGWPDNSVDAVVTDGPYELKYMARKWDGTGIVYSVEMWEQVLRVLKPGGHLLSFGATRTYHRMACAVEDAGFEIRDSIDWFYGSGFPKSQDAAREWDMHVCTLPGRHCDKNPFKKPRPDDHFCPAAPGREKYVGRRTALKGAHEPIVMARKPLEGSLIENLIKFNTGAINVDLCRIATEENLNGGGYAEDPEGRYDGDESWRFKPGGAGEFVQPSGRWPANVLLDEEAAAELDSQTADLRIGGSLNGDEGANRSVVSPLALGPRTPWTPYGDSGGASRFFYVAKPGRKEKDSGCDSLPMKTAGEMTNREEGDVGMQSPRAGAGRTSNGARNDHPTIKPVQLMAYLCRLITPPGGVVLDPFLGSGTTGVAALQEGFRFIGIEKEFEYLAIANARITNAVNRGTP